MRSDVRDRLVLPILLPLGIVVFLAILLWGFSRLLLGITATAATAMATIVAGGILAVSAVAAKRTTIRGSTIAAAFGATAGIAMLAGGIALAVVGEAEVEEHEGPGPGAAVDLVAANIAFEPANLSVPAGVPFEIAFDNRDGGVQHNVAIFDNPEFSGTALFDGPLIAGPTQTTYAVDPLAPGAYFFLCVVHPAMTGEIEAVEGAGAPGEGPDGVGPGGGGPSGGEGPGGQGPGGVPAQPSTVVAEGIAFDTGTISLPARQPASLTFDNRDAGIPHNVAIYADDSVSEVLFQGELVTGPTTVDYSIPPLEAGEYFFQCDVHPNMSGSVTVA